jgi:hypothetical protein
MNIEPSRQRMIESAYVAFASSRSHFVGITYERLQDAMFAACWTAAGYLDTEKSFRRIMGYRDLWILKAVLDEDKHTEEVMVA